MARYLVVCFFCCLSVIYVQTSAASVSSPKALYGYYLQDKDVNNPTTFSVFNQGGYIAKFIVDYNVKDDSGKVVHQSYDSGGFTAGFSRLYTLPSNAVGSATITLKYDNWFTYDNLTKKTVNENSGKWCSKLWGTTFSPQYDFHQCS